MSPTNSIFSKENAINFHHQNWLSPILLLHGPLLVLGIFAGAKAALKKLIFTIEKLSSLKSIYLLLILVILICIKEMIG
jgi:hypothetical protein